MNSDCNLEDLNREELLDFYSIGSSLPRERFALDSNGGRIATPTHREPMIWQQR